MDEKTGALITSLELRLKVTDKALLTDLVEEATAQVLDYTGQKKLIGNLGVYVKRLAIINYNRLGIEGEAQRSEGGVTNSLEVGIPKDVRQGLNRYRIAKVTKL